MFSKLANSRESQRIILALLLSGIATADSDIAQLHWLSGCWAANDKEQGSIEYWTAPAGNSMLGVSRSVREGSTVFFEYMRIVVEDTNDIVFVASPDGQTTATFALIYLDDSKVVFENPQHDFPQRVIYRLEQPSQLVGRIEGTVDGVPRSTDFPMTKVSCDGNKSDTNS